MNCAVSQLLENVEIERMSSRPSNTVQQQSLPIQNDNQSQIQEVIVRDDEDSIDSVDVSIGNNIDNQSATEDGLEVAPPAPNMRKRKLRQHEVMNKRVSNGSSKRSLASGPVTMEKWNDFL